jgi:WD40 repeat protein
MAVSTQGRFAMKKQDLRLASLGLLVAGTCLLLTNRCVAQEIKKRADLEVDPARLVTTLAFSPDSKILVGGEDHTGLAGRVWVWDVTTGKRVVSFQGHHGRVISLAISPDGKTVASGDRGGEIKLFEAATGKEKATLKPQLGGEDFLALTFGADGKTLTSVSQLELKVWELSSGKGKKSVPLRSDVGEGENLYQVARFSADGSALALGNQAGTLKLWDVAGGKEKAKLKGHKAAIVALAISKDGKIVATGSQDATIRIWDATTNKEQAMLKSAAPVTSLAFSPDGKMLASGHKRAGAKVEIKIWDMAGAKEKVTLRGEHSKDVYSVAFSPDGQFLASGGEDETVVLWQLPPVKTTDK